MMTFLILTDKVFGGFLFNNYSDNLKQSSVFVVLV